MAFFKNNKKVGLIADIIRCDEEDYLIWKWHKEGLDAGVNAREYAIRNGSPLRVKDGSVAVFVYRQKGNVYQDFIEGPADTTIHTGNLPVLSGIIGLAFNGGSPFQAEVYFINLARIIQIKFAIPFFDIYDPRFADFGVPVAVRGTVSFKINNYKDFIKLHRLDTFTLMDFERQVKDSIIRYVKGCVSNIPTKNNLSVIQIERMIPDVITEVEGVLRPRFANDFGVDVSGVDISAIEVDKSSEGYENLQRITTRTISATIEAQTQANITKILEQQRIEVEHEEESKRISREEYQYEKRMKTRTDNISAYQMEKQAEVGIAGADAIGKMGGNGAGTVSLGDGGMGFNPAAMMTSIAVGGAIGRNIADVMNTTLQTTQTPPPVPPPILNVQYYIAINGQQQGPFDLPTTIGKIQQGQITRTTLVWCAGMQGWENADTRPDLSPYFPPSIP